MPIIDRKGLPEPRLAREAVEVAELGGSVTVRGITLRERMRLRAIAGSREPGVAESFVDELLALTVLDCSDAPVFTAAQWDVWGTDKVASYGLLVEKAMELGGFNGAAAKKD